MVRIIPSLLGDYLVVFGSYRIALDHLYLHEFKQNIGFLFSVKDDVRVAEKEA